MLRIEVLCTGQYTKKLISMLHGVNSNKQTQQTCRILPPLLTFGQCTFRSQHMSNHASFAFLPTSKADKAAAALAFRTMRRIWSHKGRWQERTVRPRMHLGMYAHPKCTSTRSSSVRRSTTLSPLSSLSGAPFNFTTSVLRC